MQKIEEVKGIIAASITPTDRHGEVNATGVRKLTNFILAGGVHGIFAGGSAGEGYALTHDEKIRVAEITVDETNGRVPVFMGASGNTTRGAIKLAQAAETIAADAITVMAPPFSNCSQDELFVHFKSIAESTRLPVLLYSLPARTVGLSAALVKRLSEVDNIIGLKDSSGDLSLLVSYMQSTPKDFKIWVGCDTMILAALIYGAAGAVAASASVAPDLVVSIYAHYKNGDLAKALEAQFRLAPLRRMFTLGSTTAAMLKAAANLLELDVGEPIAPVHKLSEEKKAQLRAVLVDQGIL